MPHTSAASARRRPARARLAFKSAVLNRVHLNQTVSYTANDNDRHHEASLESQCAQKPRRKTKKENLEYQNENQYQYDRAGCPSGQAPRPCPPKSASRSPERIGPPHARCDPGGAAIDPGFRGSASSTHHHKAKYSETVSQVSELLCAVTETPIRSASTSRSENHTNLNPYLRHTSDAIKARAMSKAG